MKLLNFFNSVGFQMCGTGPLPLKCPLKEGARQASKLCVIAKIRVAIDSSGQYLAVASGSRCVQTAAYPLSFNRPLKDGKRQKCLKGSSDRQNKGRNRFLISIPGGRAGDGPPPWPSERASGADRFMTFCSGYVIAFFFIIVYLFSIKRLSYKIALRMVEVGH